MSEQTPVKHVVITGGVVSGLGKGITGASLARLLISRGYSVRMQKLDPYLNIDPGTLNPFEHGEVFVTDDGGEVDLDLGHYERFSDTALSKVSSVTSGSIYASVLESERRGDYKGKTVQVIPHVTDALLARMHALSAGATATPDVVIIELGGTVGDIESLAHLEAIRRLRKNVGRDNFCLLHVALVPTVSPSGEAKTKPVQHSVTELRSRGLTPDVIVARSQHELPAGLKDKISHLCDVEPERVVSAIDCDNLYRVPLNLHEQGLDRAVMDVLGLAEREARLSAWQEMVERAVNADRPMKVAIVGKYTALPDAYLSVVEATRHAGWSLGLRTELVWVAADDVDANSASRLLAGCDAVIIPGGFGERGVEGKIAAAAYTRAHNVPTLGICLGMQVMVIDVARALVGLTGAHSAELEPATAHPVVHLMSDQHGVENLGGTLRLGSYPCVLEPDSLAQRSYGATFVHERHRHRYEVNNDYRDQLSDHGLRISGTSPDGHLVEIVELTGHRFWLGTQAHPEFISRPDRPHPLFVALLRAATDI